MHRYGIILFENAGSIIKLCARLKSGFSREIMFPLYLKTNIKELSTPGLEFLMYIEH